LLLTVLPTSPRFALCLERARTDAGVTKYIDVAGRWDDFAQAIVPIPAIERRTGWKLPAAPNSITDPVRATEVLDSLEAELRSPTPWTVIEGRRRRSTSRSRSIALRAAALAAAGGYCGGCSRDYAALLQGAGENALQVHHLKPLSLSPAATIVSMLDDVVVLCAACHAILESPARPTLGQLQNAWAAS
jgi:hypothetical protein